MNSNGWYREGLEDGRNGSFVASFDGMTRQEIEEYQSGWQIGCNLRAMQKGKLILCR